VVLLALAVAVSWLGGLRRGLQLGMAALRATIQLAVVALVITALLGHVVWSTLFGVFMLGIATITSSRRIEAPRAWPVSPSPPGCCPPSW